MGPDDEDIREVGERPTANTVIGTVLLGLGSSCAGSVRTFCFNFIITHYSYYYKSKTRLVFVVYIRNRERRRMKLKGGRGQKLGTNPGRNFHTIIIQVTNLSQFSASSRSVSTEGESS